MKRLVIKSINRSKKPKLTSEDLLIIETAAQSGELLVFSKWKLDNELMVRNNQKRLGDLFFVYGSNAYLVYGLWGDLSDLLKSKFEPITRQDDVELIVKLIWDFCPTLQYDIAEYLLTGKLIPAAFGDEHFFYEKLLLKLPGDATDDIDDIKRSDRAFVPLLVDYDGNVYYLNEPDARFVGLNYFSQ